VTRASAPAGPGWILIGTQSYVDEIDECRRVAFAEERSFLLRGHPSSESEWVVEGRVAEIFDNLIAAGKVKPMIVVMPNGHPDQGASPDVFSPSDPSLPPLPKMDPKVFEAHTTSISDSLVSDVIPFVEKNFRVKSDRSDRAIAGLSMGGAQAVYVGLNHLDRFAWLASFSGAFILWPGAMVEEAVPQNGSSARAPGSVSN